MTKALPPGLTDMATPDSEARRQPFSISLFWRTFVLLGLLLLSSAIGWYQLFRTLEYEPRVIDNARQVASLVNLSRAALIHSDAIARISLMKTLAEQEKVRILPREPDDSFHPFAQTTLERRLSHELVARLGPGTVVASQVNDEPGLWVGFSIEGDSYWLLMDRSRVGALLGGGAWLLWLATLVALSLLGAALLARLINRPLQQLSRAAARVREGNYQHGRLDETALSSEVRAVNIGFNRMAEQLSKIEQDRAQMLAGISHDLRTPLARLRLEAEMSVPDAEARQHMVADIEQVDTIIAKFLDYARPDHANLQALPLAELVDASAVPFLLRDDMRVHIDIPADLHVLGDEVELSRVLANLLENARRYGKSADGTLAQVDISARAVGKRVVLHLRDHGQGVPKEQLASLTRPFFRGDSARTEATGAGLGLAIVAKMLRNMGGSLEFHNHPDGGLATRIGLQVASPIAADKHGTH
ncbi:MAG: HAMP domain-containing protein [Burkholderiales bacterium]|nr:HAMP domain-containing protein [Burkholderiales bacterium]MBK8665107.1 HAMP domain-containing protein [Burkholderiales bacterium]